MLKWICFLPACCAFCYWPPSFDAPPSGKTEVTYAYAWDPRVATTFPLCVECPDCYMCDVYVANHAGVTNHPHMRELKADIYDYDASSTRLKTAIVVGHGGNFEGGQKGDDTGKGLDDHETEYASALAQHGFWVMEIDYRTFKNHNIPHNTNLPDYSYAARSSGASTDGRYKLAAVSDFRAAIRYARSQSNVDSGRVAVSGDSAGAITALWTAYNLGPSDIPAYGAEGHSLSVCNGARCSSRDSQNVQTVIPISGHTDDYTSLTNVHSGPGLVMVTGTDEGAIMSTTKQAEVYAASRLNTANPGQVIQILGGQHVPIVAYDWIFGIYFPNSGSLLYGPGGDSATVGHTGPPGGYWFNFMHYLDLSMNLTAQQDGKGCAAIGEAPDGFGRAQVHGAHRRATDDVFV